LGNLLPAFARLAQDRGAGVATGNKLVHIGARFYEEGEHGMEELNGRMLACQILITGLIARVANDQRDPLRFLSDFRDEIKAVVNGINIAGMDNTERVRQIASRSVDELFSLMKPPSSD
jgi:hypothetical protein